MFILLLSGISLIFALIFFASAAYSKKNQSNDFIFLVLAAIYYMLISVLSLLGYFKMISLKTATVLFFEPIFIGVTYVVAAHAQ